MPHHYTITISCLQKDLKWYRKNDTEELAYEIIKNLALLYQLKPDKINDHLDEFFDIKFSHVVRRLNLHMEEKLNYPFINQLIIEYFVDIIDFSDTTRNHPFHDNSELRDEFSRYVRKYFEQTMYCL